MNEAGDDFDPNVQRLRTMSHVPLSKRQVNQAVREATALTIALESIEGEPTWTRERKARAWARKRMERRLNTRQAGQARTSEPYSREPDFVGPRGRIAKLPKQLLDADCAVASLEEYLTADEREANKYRWIDELRQTEADEHSDYGWLVEPTLDDLSHGIDGPSRRDPWLTYDERRTLERAHKNAVRRVLAARHPHTLRLLQKAKTDATARIARLRAEPTGDKQNSRSDTELRQLRVREMAARGALPPLVALDDERAECDICFTLVRVKPDGRTLRHTMPIGKVCKGSDKDAEAMNKKRVARWLEETAAILAAATGGEVRVQHGPAPGTPTRNEGLTAHGRSRIRPTIGHDQSQVVPQHAQRSPA